MNEKNIIVCLASLRNSSICEHDGTKAFVTGQQLSFILTVLQAVRSIFAKMDMQVFS